MRLATSFLVFISVYVFSLSAAPSALATDLMLKEKGQPKTVNVETIAAPTDLTVIEPHEQKPVRFKALPLNTVLDSFYGKAWRSEEELLVTCKDGYQPSLPVKLLLEHKAYLAVARDDGPFAIENRLQNNEKVDLGPLYLIWDNQTDKGIQSHGASVWPYQVTQLEFVSFDDRFAAMAPPKRSSKAAKEGFLAFRHFCQSCHRINGQGGDKSVELNYPINVTEYYRLEYLEKWIDDPQSIRFGTVMPGLSAEAPDRKKMIHNLIAYLKSMKAKKINPVESKK